MKWIFLKLNYMKWFLWAPILFHTYDIVWLNDLCITILSFNAIQSFFFYSTIILILSFICKNSLLSLFRQKLFLLGKGTIILFKNRTSLLDFFKNFNKLFLDLFIRNKFNDKK